MTFNLDTVRRFYPADTARKLERYGFTFAPVAADSYTARLYSIPSGSEIFSKLTSGHLTVDTLEELQAFVQEWGDVVLSTDEIVIYDDYLE